MCCSIWACRRTPTDPPRGLAALDDIIAAAPATKVIVMTGQTERVYAVQAVGAGAYDFYQKPIEIDVLAPIVNRAYGLYQLEEENRELSNAAAATPIPGLITANPMMQDLLRKVREIAPTDVSVLLYGESGTGKELFARATHDLGRRKRNRFVAINCAAIPDQLLESELFGHERGAFTGAIKMTKGKVEIADGGTLFLDEIGDLSLHLQAKLLRFLQERVIERIGGHQPIKVDVRVVAATNKDLLRAIEKGEFREDLYYRLSEVTIEIPPLRERPEDSVVIANHFVQSYSRDQGRNVRGFSNDALVAISTHLWPGNVRELQNRIKGAVITASGTKITAADLELDNRGRTSGRVTLRKARDRAESQAVSMAMLQANGNVSTAAKLLDISRPKLYDLIRLHNIRPS